MANDNQKRAQLAWRQIQKKGYKMKDGTFLPYTQPDRLSPKHNYNKVVANQRGA